MIQAQIKKNLKSPRRVSLAPDHIASRSAFTFVNMSGVRAPRASTSAAPTRSSKRAAATRDDAQDDLPAVVLDTLGLGSRELVFDNEDDSGEESAGDSAEDEDDAGEAFPEIEFGDEEEDDDEDFSDEIELNEEYSEDDEDDESLGLVDPDEEAALLAEIEAEDALEAAEEEDTVDKFLARHTSKPNEASELHGSFTEDPTMLRDFMRRSKTVISSITGEEKTEWDQEIDAGYGSDSSTEEVSLDSTVAPSYPRRADPDLPLDRRPIGLEMFLPTFTTICPTLGTILTAKRLCAPPPVTSWIDSWRMLRVKMEAGTQTLFETFWLIYQTDPLAGLFQDIGQGQTTRQQCAADGSRTRLDSSSGQE